MSLSSRLFAAVSALAAVLAPFCAARGQGADPAQFYSLGVHAYFSGQSSRAEEFLSRALSVDPQDPRAYYFRGLSRLRQGRSPEARSDMQIGASIEAQQLNRFAVGQALERVQGGDRILLEQYRQTGRRAESNVRSERDRQRYERVVGREVEVLHRRATIALDQLSGANGSRPVVILERNPQPVAASAIPVFRPAAAVSAAASSDNPFPDDPATPPAGGAAHSAGTPVAATGAGGAASPTPLGSAAVDENPFATPSAPGGASSAPQPTPRNQPTTPQPAGDVDLFRAP